MIPRIFLTWYSLRSSPVSTYWHTKREMFSRFLLTADWGVLLTNISIMIFITSNGHASRCLSSFFCSTIVALFSASFNVNYNWNGSFWFSSVSMLMVSFLWINLFFNRLLFCLSLPFDLIFLFLFCLNTLCSIKASLTFFMSPAHSLAALALILFLSFANLSIVRFFLSIIRFIFVLI